MATSVSPTTSLVFVLQLGDVEGISGVFMLFEDIVLDTGGGFILTFILQFDIL